MTDGPHLENMHLVEEKNLQPSLRSATGLLLAVFILLLVVGSVAQLLHFELGMLVTQWILILLPALWYWRRYRVDRPTFARVKPLQKKYFSTILLLVVSVWAINVIITTTLANFLINYGYEPIVAVPYPETISQLLRYYLVIAFSAGICEEVLFRGTIMPAFERQGGVVPALVFSALLFALFHISYINFFSIFILGLIIGLLVIKTGSLWAGILYHMLNNAIAVTYMYLVVNTELNTYLENSSSGVLLTLTVLLIAGAAYGLIRLQQQSGGMPLLTNRLNWLPTGWLNWATVCIICIFLFFGAMELLMGFGVFNGS